MIITFFFIYFLLLSCLPHLLHSAIPPNKCPESFTCPNHSPFTYSFYNASVTGCGLINVKCTASGGEIQLGNQSYEIIYKLDTTSLIIKNDTFEKLVKEEKCEALMDNFTSPSPLLFSFSLIYNITVFRCKQNPSYTQVTDACFDRLKYHRINRSCKEHNFDYLIPINHSTVEIPSNLPHTCQVIKLPLQAPCREFQDHHVPDGANIFSLVSFDVSISFQVSDFCDECHKNNSHYCHATNNGTHVECLLVPAEKKHRRRTLILALGVGVVAFIVGAATISTVKILSLKRKFGWRLKAKYNIKAELIQKGSYSQVKKMTSSFKVKLGQGAFGFVYRGALNNQSVVAVKILRESKGKGEDFTNEVASVGRTSHVNIVNLVGFCLEGRRRALIYEFMPNGSLENFIYGQASPSNTQLGWEKLHQIAIGIARGLEYLHRGCNTRILHFDIKPHNILLDQDFCPKIADFGLAKLFPEKKSMISVTDMRGTPGYIAPELFSRSFGVVSHKSDVYSYGMMILEMIGGRKNIEVKAHHTSEIYFPHWIYKQVELDEDHLGLQEIVSDEEKGIAKKMIIVGLWCIQTNPLNRPTITKALEMLEGNLELLEVPPKPYITTTKISFSKDNKSLLNVQISLLKVYSKEMSLLKSRC